ncbi:RNA 3'-terminal phosphate cyclase [Vulgatibacter sp.]|uniref:RNA 3'-terminal phosphate cyclase n=1 Tax=Vulgatibacter sp. TaxID=1971226 RepID=UPI0035655FC2
MSDRADIQLDGSAGEGGGQILRTALTLSVITGKPFELLRIRAGREEPGLQAQHLAAVRAAADISGALVEGDSRGSQHLLFRPAGSIRGGEHLFEIGTAGSTSLLLQTVALPLCLADQPSEVRIRGGTHVSRAPTFHDLALGWAPLLRSIGWPIDVRLVGAGFYPEGGGEVVATIGRAQPARPVDRRRRGTLTEVRVVPIVAGLHGDVAPRMGQTARTRLREAGVPSHVESMALPAGPSHGAAIAIQAIYEKIAVTFGALAEPGKPAEQVAGEAVEDFEWHHASGMALDEHLADQILLPLALASAGKQGGPTPIHRVTVTEVNRHLLTNAAVIRRFLPVEIAVFGREGEPGDIRVAPEGIGEVLPLLRSERQGEEG